MIITVAQGHLIRRAKHDGLLPQQIVSRFGIPLRIVNAVLEGRDPPGGYHSPVLVDVDLADKGRVELRKYMISRKVPDGVWPQNETIDRARRDYDAGRIELCQGRSQEYIFLYAIPRKIVVTRRHPYFGEAPAYISPEE